MNNCYGYEKKFNDKYENVFFEGVWWRLYDERFTSSLDAFYSESQIKLIEFIESYNFKVFYFNCEPATDNILILNDGLVNLDDTNVIEIKKNQLKDFYYIYSNQLCEVFYSFPKIDSENKYFFDFMLVVNQNFEIDSIFKYNFQSVKIKSIKEITLQDLSFEFVENIFEQRILIENNCALIHEKEYYNIFELGWNFKEYIEEQKKKGLPIEHEEYLNFNSFIFYTDFNQDLYVKTIFKLICTHIWSIDRIFYKEKNKYGLRLSYKEKYNLGSPFLTNFAELIGCTSVDLENSTLQKENFTYSSLYDNFHDQNISSLGFNSKLIKNGKLNIIDLDNLEIIEVKDE